MQEEGNKYTPKYDTFLSPANIYVDLLVIQSTSHFYYILRTPVSSWKQTVKLKTSRIVPNYSNNNNNNNSSTSVVPEHDFFFKILLIGDQGVGSYGDREGYSNIIV